MLANGQVQYIISLPVVTGTLKHIYNILENCTGLSYHENWIVTNAYVKIILYELPTISANLVKGDDDWEEQWFGELTENLRKYTKP